MPRSETPRTPEQDQAARDARNALRRQRYAERRGVALAQTEASEAWPTIMAADYRQILLRSYELRQIISGVRRGDFIFTGAYDSVTQNITFELEGENMPETIETPANETPANETPEERERNPLIAKTITGISGAEIQTTEYAA